MKNKEKILSEVLSSNEFIQFRGCLKMLNDSIENVDIELLMDSLTRLGSAKDNMVEKLKKTQIFAIRNYLGNQINLDLISMETKENSIEIYYNKYIPSFFDQEKKIYSSIDTKIVTIHLKEREIYVHPNEKTFKKAINIQNSLIISQKLSIDKLKEEIEYLQNKSKSKLYVVNLIENSEKMKSLNLKKINIIINKNKFKEYKKAYLNKINKKEEELELLKLELQKEKRYRYEDFFYESNEIQQDIKKSFEKNNFKVKQKIST